MLTWILLAANLAALAFGAGFLTARQVDRAARPPFTGPPPDDEWGTEEWWLDTGPRANGSGPAPWGHHR